MFNDDWDCEKDDEEDYEVERIICALDDIVFSGGTGVPAGCIRKITSKRPGLPETRNDTPFRSHIDSPARTLHIPAN